MRNRMAMTCVMLGLAVTLIKTNLVWGAPATPNPDFVDPVAPERPLTEEQRAQAASIDIAPKPPGQMSEARKIGYFHKYRSGLSAFYFGGVDTKSIADGDNNLISRLTLQYLFATPELRAFEVGADLQNDGSGALGLSYRWIFSRTAFRPYTKLGAAVRIDPADQLATFLRLKHYQLRGNVGFEYTLSDPISLRMDVEAQASARAIEGLVGLGSVWAW